MSWSVTEWTPGNIQQHADEFWKAIKERKVVMGEDVSGFLIPQPGAILQSTSTKPPGSTTGVFSFRWIQDWIFSYSTCQKFARSHDADGNIYDVPTTGDELMALTGWGQYNLLASVSGDPAMNQFRRATTWPSDWTDWNDPAYSLGKIQLYSPFTTSDIMGPWIFADIQSALNKLIWTWGREGWTANGTNNYWTGISDWGYGVQEDPDWLEAKTEAESRYSIFGSAENEPWTYSLGHNYSVPRHYGLKAWLYRKYSWPYVFDMPDTYAREIDWAFLVQNYANDDFPEGIFDDNGDGLTEGWNYHGMTSHAAGSGDTYIHPTVVGNNTTPEDYPTWCAYPWGKYVGTARGYYVSSQRTLIRWNVNGGLEYC